MRRVLVRVPPRLGAFTKPPKVSAKSPPKPKKPVALQAKKPAKLELDGSKWLIVSLLDPAWLPHFFMAF
jgi:hypothetical protein